MAASRRSRRSGSSRKRKTFPPETAFRHAVALLNNANSDALWKVSARCSLHDVFTEPEEPYFLLPVLNAEKIRAFGQVIIASRASSDKLRMLSDNELRQVFNDCNDVLNNTEALARLKQANGTDRARFEFHRFLSQVANIQFPQQDVRVLAQAGRVIAMFEVLPRINSDLIPPERRQQVETALSRIPQILSVSLTSLAECFFVVLAYQAIAQLASRRALDMFLAGVRPATQSDEFRNAVLSGLLSYYPEDVMERWLLFDSERLTGLFALERASEFMASMEAFLRLFSANTTDLRATLQNRPEFSLGHISSRLSPLERYPIVRLESSSGDSRLIVPNCRHLSTSFNHVIDFTLLEKIGETYSHARGALQELYLRCLVTDRLPDLLVIPETAYGRPELRGPDLTLIDKRCHRIILVESKGRRMTLSTRLTMEPEIFNKNVEDAYSALLNLPQKLADLYAGRSEYSKYQEAIDITRNTDPVFVVVLSEGVYFMSHLIRLQARKVGDYLHGFHYKYCVLSLDIFERAVEISRRHNRSLYELLEEHYARSGSEDNVSPSADMFGGAEIDEEDTFAANFAPSWPSLPSEVSF